MTRWIEPYANRAEFLRDQRGSSFTQMIVLVTVLALGGIAGVKTLRDSLQGRMDCAAESITSLSTGPCGAGPRGGIPLPPGAPEPNAGAAAGTEVGAAAAPPGANTGAAAGKARSRIDTGEKRMAAGIPGKTSPLPDAPRVDKPGDDGDPGASPDNDRPGKPGAPDGPPVRDKPDKPEKFRPLDPRFTFPESRFKPIRPGPPPVPAPGKPGKPGRPIDRPIPPEPGFQPKPIFRPDPVPGPRPKPVVPKPGFRPMPIFGPNPVPGPRPKPVVPKPGFRPPPARHPRPVPHDGVPSHVSPKRQPDRPSSAPT